MRSYNGGRTSSISNVSTTPSAQSAAQRPAWMQNAINKMLKGGSLSKGDIRRLEQHVLQK